MYSMIKANINMHGNYGSCSNMGHEDCAPLSSIEPFPFAFRLSGSSSISTEATDATARADQHNIQNKHLPKNNHAGVMMMLLSILFWQPLGINNKRTIMQKETMCT